MWDMLESWLKKGVRWNMWHKIFSKYSWIQIPSFSDFKAVVFECQNFWKQWNYRFWWPMQFIYSLILCSSYVYLYPDVWLKVTDLQLCLIFLPQFFSPPYVDGNYMWVKSGRWWALNKWHLSKVIFSITL